MTGSTEFWDGEAAAFDQEPDHGLTDPQVREAWRTLLLGLLPEPPARVLDLGCGTGSLSVLLAEAGFTVSGVDSSPEMLARARVKAKGLPIGILLGDAADPQIPPACVDVVLCRHLLWSLPDPAAAVERWARLLAPGGIIVTVEGRWSTGAGLAAATTERLLQAVGRTVTTRRLDDPRLWGGPIMDERYVAVSTPTV